MRKQEVILRAFPTWLFLPENRAVSGALLYEYPKYQYHRVAERNQLDIVFR